MPCKQRAARCSCWHATCPPSPPPLIAELAASPGAIAVARAGGRLHPLCARYDPEVLAALRSALAAEAPLVATVEALDPFVVDVDPAVVANVNRPEDLRGRSTTFPP
jgi:molybdopterin-guanine dinucleotide biosynthesis protein A